MQVEEQTRLLTTGSAFFRCSSYPEEVHLGFQALAQTHVYEAGLELSVRPMAEVQFSRKISTHLTGNFVS